MYCDCLYRWWTTNGYSSVFICISWSNTHLAEFLLSSCNLMSSGPNHHLLINWDSVITAILECEWAMWIDRQFSWVRLMWTAAQHSNISIQQAMLCTVSVMGPVTLVNWHSDSLCGDTKQPQSVLHKNNYLNIACIYIYIYTYRYCISLYYFYMSDTHM